MPFLQFLLSYSFFEQGFIILTINFKKHNVRSYNIFATVIIISCVIFHKLLIYYNNYLFRKYVHILNRCMVYILINYIIEFILHDLQTSDS